LQERNECWLIAAKKNEFSAMNEWSHVMPKANWMVLTISSMLLPAASLADDAMPESAGDRQATLTISDSATYMELAYDARWSMSNTTDTVRSPAEMTGPIAKFDFQDNSTIGRFSKLRNLSVLTFAEFGTARLFLGVNDDGLVGLHFNAIVREGDERYLEFIRMPYLKQQDPAEETEQH